MTESDMTPWRPPGGKPSASEWIEVGARMQRVVRAVGKSRLTQEDVEDLGQDSLIDFYRTHAEAGGQVGVGLQVTIATRRTLDFLRKRARRKTDTQSALGSDDDRSDPFANIPDPKSLDDAELRPDELRAILALLMDATNLICRELWQVFIRTGSQLAVAEALGLAPNTVAKRWERCRKAIRKLGLRDSGRLGQWFRDLDAGGTP